MKFEPYQRTLGEIHRQSSMSLACIFNIYVNFPIMTCIICGARSNFCAIKEGYVHYKCTHCRHIQISPFPSNEDLHLYYSKDYVFTDCDEQPKKKEKSTPILNYIRANFQDVQATSCLDIGAGNGRFLGELNALGFNKLYAVEPNEGLAKVLHHKGYTVETGMMNNERFGTFLFNLINAGDVIEHLVDPTAFIQSLRSKLSEDGLLIITTPNIESIWSRYTYILYKYFSIPWSSLTPIAHLNNFSYSSLRLLLLSNSFQIVDCYFSSPSLKYELGHTHLFRAFRERKNLKNLLSWAIGWTLYVVGFYPAKLLSRRVGMNFKMTLIAKAV